MNVGLASSEITFRVLAMALLVVMNLIRRRTGRRADNREARSALRENTLDTLLLFPVTFLLQLSIVAYAVFPDLIAWAQISLPVWSRWIGVALGIGALSLLAWADRELGKNFSMTLRIREDHTLITTGPYHWIRHPIYSVGLLFGFAVFLVSANGFVGVCWIGGCSLLYAHRIPKEEALMLEEFADEYRAYMQRTGRLLPRCFK